MNNFSAWIHAILAILSLTLLYPLLGQAYILVLIPYVLFLVFCEDAKYFPALAINTTVGGGIIGILIFISFILLAIKNYNKYDKNIKLVFGLLISTLPVLAYLTYQRISLDGDNLQLALSNSGAISLGLFAFFYGFAIRKSITKQVFSVLIWCVIIIAILQINQIIIFQRITTLLQMVAFGGVVLIFSRNKISFGLFTVLLAFAAYFLATSEESTFTNLAMVLFTSFLVWLYIQKKIRLIYRVTGIIVPVLILLLYYVGITSYMSEDFSKDIQGLDLTSLDNLTTRLQFKFFGDRAPIWAGAFNQIVTQNSLFPVHNLDKVIMTLQSNAEVEFGAGAHTTILEYFRKYGYLLGGIYVFCYFKLLFISRKALSIPNLDPYFLLMLSAAVSSTIFVALSGTYAVLVVYALLTFGVLGIGYGYYIDNLNNK